MAWTTYQIAIALLMVVTGSINTLSVKWANQLKAENSIGLTTDFNHPFLQASGMFLGELACMAAFYMQVCYLKGKAKPPPGKNEKGETKLPFTLSKVWVLLIPAMCDMTATSVMYVGLTLTNASSFQMLRGAVIIFTGLSSMAFLRRRLQWFQWLGMFVILAGLVIVGAADLINPAEPACVNKITLVNDSTTTMSPITMLTPEPADPPYDKPEQWCGETSGASNEIVGDILIVGAQVVVSLQMVYEEKVLSKYEMAPLQTVGWEGFFGFVVLTLLLIPFGYIETGSELWGHSPKPPFYLEDAIDGLIQLGNNGLLLTAFCGTIVSIAFFNFAGVSVTKEMSATTRMVLDSIRTLIIWAVSLALSWQSFQYLQPIGFIVLLVGMSLYNDLLIMPFIRSHFASEPKSKKELLA